MPDKRLFTPGPLTTSLTVKKSMLHDLGSRDEAFIDRIQYVRNTLLELAGTSQADGFEAILMQGSGTFGLESTIGSITPRGGTLLVVINGAYGERVLKMADVLGIHTIAYRTAEDQVPDPSELDALLDQHPEVTTVSAVHCETTTGILNPVLELGRVVNKHNCRFMVDGMSTFGAIHLDLEAAHVDYLVTSANKCLEGVPGFAVILARREALLETRGFARSLSLDLLAQWEGLEKNGQFRFTPPTHAILAIARALEELGEEGGIAGRGRRYETNHRIIKDGMTRMGFKSYLDASLQGPIITSFYYPDDPRFDFHEFYDRLSARDMLIYPGKLTQADCFRIGNIGRLFPDDMNALLDAVSITLHEMKIELPSATAPAPSTN